MISGNIQWMTWTLVFVRFLGISLVIPGGLRPGMLFARIACAAVLTIATRPLRLAQPTIDSDVFLLGLMQEAILGICCGLGLAILLTGLGLITTSPSMEDSAWQEGHFGQGVWYRLAWLFSIALFLGMDGHRTLIQTLMAFMNEHPPGSRILGDDLRQGLFILVSCAVRITLRMAQPFMVAAAGVALVGGIVARISPGLATIPFSPAMHFAMSLTLLLFGLGGVSQQMEVLIGEMDSAFRTFLLAQH